MAFLYLNEMKNISYSEGVWITEEQNVKGERCCAEHVQREVLLLFTATKI